MKIKLITLAIALAVLAPFANANLITNGDFESSTFSGDFTTYNAGSTGLAGWTIEAGSVDLINTYWAAASGHYSLDISGNDDGVISQTFATVVGQKYVVSFSLAGNPDDSDSLKTIQVGLAGNPLYTFDTANKSRGNMGWVSQSFEFTAAGTSSKLFFASMQDSAFGAALDNVSVTAVPEPETYAMLLAGLGLMGAVTRRRNGASK